MTAPALQLRTLLTELLPAEWVAAVESDDRAAVARCAADESVARPAVTAVAAAGWLVAEWPREYGGLALSPDDAAAVRRELARWHVGTVESAIGTGWVGPAVLRYAEPDVAAEVLPPIARNEVLWCQLFSEPEAGSDLAAVRTRGVLDEAAGTWRLDGRKIWTSRADRAGWGLCVARTDPNVPKHAGLTCFLLDMSTPGVTVRPILQMTGDAEFFEVTLDDVVVPDRYRIGTPSQGWEIVRAVLALERVAGSGAGAATPGSVVGRSVDDLVAQYLDDAGPAHRDAIAHAWVEAQVIGWVNRRHALTRAAERPPVANGAPYPKVLQAEHTKRLQRLFTELGGLRVLAHEPGDREAERDTWAYLRVQPKTIAGGTSEVLRDQIAERALGLPRGTDPSRKVAWRTFLADNDKSGRA